MRLALFTDTFAPQMNGVSRTLERLVGETERRGGTVRVFTVSDPRIERAERPDIRRSASVACPFYPELRIALPRAESLARVLHDFRPDLVHAATPFGVGLAGLRAARARGLPFVTSYHTNFSAYARYYRLGALRSVGWHYLRWFHDTGRRTFCPTYAVRNELRMRGFKRLAVWGRGVDTVRFDPAHRTRALRKQLGVSEDAIVVAYAGRIAREKGLDAVLTAMSCLRHIRSDVVWAFAGDGPYLDHCRRAALGHAVFLGRLEHDALSAFYASSDIAVFPSSTDTFGNVLVESMASGLPVIAADCATSREILGAAGTYHGPGDGGQLANLILELVLNAARRKALARVARLRARQFSWNAAFDSLFTEYETVLAEPERVAGAPRRARSSLVPQGPR